jgi:hypothetical protein
MNAMTVKELISALKSMNNPSALVAVASDSEGNGFSLIPNEQFIAEGFMAPTLGSAELYIKPQKGTKPVLVLFGSN